jgi:hypothetical protein
VSFIAGDPERKFAIEFGSDRDAPITVVRPHYALVGVSGKIAWLDKALVRLVHLLNLGA